MSDIYISDDEYDKRSAKTADYMASSSVQLRAISNLDIEMNEVLANVLKEEDRQRYILQQFTELLDRNTEILGI